MFGGKTVHLFLSLVFCSSVTVFGQWSTANSGTTNNLNGVYLLDSGIAFVVGDAGTILKSTDAGATRRRFCREQQTFCTLCTFLMVIKASQLETRD